MSVVSVVLSGGGFCDGLITRPEQSYRICVCVCVYDREASTMMRPGPLWGRRTMKKVRLRDSYETRYIYLPEG